LFNTKGWSILMPKTRAKIEDIGVTFRKSYYTATTEMHWYLV